MDMLGHMLQDPMHGVLAMLLLNGAQSTSQMFTDDTTFNLAGSKENIKRTMAMFHKFGATLGAKLNVTKFVVVCVLPTKKDWSWGEAEGSNGRKLYLACKILVINQVILASTWYLCSCLDLSGKIFKKLRQLIRNYLWVGNSEANARARVDCVPVILPISQGVLKSPKSSPAGQALLVKLIPRGLKLGWAPIESSYLLQGLKL
jgi:hypothetical protein